LGFQEIEKGQTKKEKKERKEGPTNASRSLITQLKNVSDYSRGNGKSVEGKSCQRGRNNDSAHKRAEKRAKEMGAKPA